MAHSPLHSDARTFLAREVGRAREIAEKGARASLTALAVAEKVVPEHFTDAQRKLRNRLRAHARQLGDARTVDGYQEVELLTEEVAYQHWHRMLFARFLAENGLLREYDGDQPIDLDECRALAADLKLDIWVYAALCAQKMLPGVFRLDDPALVLKLDGAAQVELNTLMAGMQSEIFKATDALGWVYQYWQAKRKDEVNAAGNKVGARELSPVTQLFTEDYMVDFLLHNTLGAWWAGKMGPVEAVTEEEARAKVGLAAKDGLPAVVWTYLRFIQDGETKKWKPAAGTFDAWPKKAKDISFLDPCMGSGHFPIFALPLLSRMRLEEEGATAQQNIYSVLESQIHGLELDQRCCQLGAFNLAFTAWKLAGFQKLPSLNVACCGIAPQAKLEDWLALAGEDEKIRAGMRKLYQLFKDAPVLGSLINPRNNKSDLLEASFEDLQPILERALVVETKDEALHEMAVAARGLAKAAEILADEFTLVVTNVPYLGRPKQEERLREFCESIYPASKADLATCFIERTFQFLRAGGTVALVTPQNWLFLPKDKSLRRIVLTNSQLSIIGRLGDRAFQTPMYSFGTILICLNKVMPDLKATFCGIDVSQAGIPEEKADSLSKVQGIQHVQHLQIKNPDSVIAFRIASTLPTLGEFADAIQGASMVDLERFRLMFFEVSQLCSDWVFHQSSPSGDSECSGMHFISANHATRTDIHETALLLKNEGRLGGYKSGHKNVGKIGVLLAWLGRLPASKYPGVVYDHNTTAIIPRSEVTFPAIWAFCSSPSYCKAVRELNQKAQVNTSVLTSVPFDLDFWQKVAAEKYSSGLQKFFSSDPTQWLFNGHPYKSDNPLQVAVARLLCYQWPRQSGSSFPDCPALGPDGLEKYSDDDGIVGLSSINREEAAAPRLRALLKHSYGADWRDGVTERQLLADAGHGDSTLEEWLRDSFFEEHCELFHHRPFVWHIWDGERDGFHVLVNYHRLAAPNGEGARLLQKLAQTYLGDWIARCEADVKNEKPNAHKLLKAAKDLQADLLKILEGEAPNDIFVRWKTLHEQAIGWNPDINDGVRLNIRPFLTVRDVGKKGAGLLRIKPNIKWDKDRGSEPERPKTQFPWFWSCMPEDKPEHVTDFVGGSEFTGERWNNLHYTLAAKKAARAKFTPKK